VPLIEDLKARDLDLAEKIKKVEIRFETDISKVINEIEKFGNLFADAESTKKLFEEYDAKLRELSEKLEETLPSEINSIRNYVESKIAGIEKLPEIYEEKFKEVSSILDSIQTNISDIEHIKEKIKELDEKSAKKEDIIEINVTLDEIKERLENEKGKEEAELKNELKKQSEDIYTLKEEVMILKQEIIKAQEAIIEINKILQGRYHEIDQ